MAGIKIVDLPPLGRDLASTDLLELSLAGGTGSRKITGQEIMNASKLSVNNTPIINGTVGRVLFQGTGDVLQQSSSLFWDNTNARLGIGTSSPSFAVDVASDIRTARLLSNIIRDSNVNTYINNIVTNAATTDITIGNNTAASITLTSKTAGKFVFTTGNVLINTTTDAGFKLDVNGTARALNNLIVYGDGTSAATRGILTIQSLGETFSGRLVFSRNNSNWYNQIETIGSGGGANLGLAINDNGTYSLVTNKGKVFIGNSLTIPTSATLQVGGAGNTSSTTSLLVQQSTGVNVLSVRDDMYVTVQNTNNTECFQVRGFNDDATIRFTPNGGTSNIVLRSQSSSITLSTTANSFGDLRVNGNAQTLRIGTSSASGGGLNYYSSLNGVTHSHRWFHNNVEQMTLFYTGNLLIGTTTDAGFKLDVNGTMRVTGKVTLNGQLDTNQTGIGHVFSRINDNGTLIRISNWNYGNSSGNTWVGGAEVASALFALNSTTTGFLPPRMTQAQRNAIASPAIGLEIYQTDATEGKYIYKSSGWTYIG